MMKKLYFIRANQSKHGGAEIYLSRLANELKKRSVSYDIIHASLPKILPSWLRVLLFNRKVCHHKNGHFYFSLERISCPDIYRAGDGVHKVFMQIEKKSKINPLHTVYLYLERRAFQNASRIIAISNMVKQDIIDSYGIEAQKIEVVYNGITLEKYNKNASFQKLEQAFSLDKNEKIILYVGSGFKRKGVEAFLTILSKVTYSNYKAFVIGKEKKMDFYKHLADRLGIGEKVIFTGVRSDVNDFYTIADIFLFPTRYEPFGNVILEAMNFSNVVITTKSCGGGEILDQDFIMDSADDFSVAGKIDELLEDEVKLQAAKERNLDIVKNFTIEKNVEKTLKVIDEVIH